MNITDLLTSILYLHCIVKKRLGRQYQSQPSKLTTEYKATQGGFFNHHEEVKRKEKA